MKTFFKDFRKEIESWSILDSFKIAIWAIAFIGILGLALIHLSDGILYLFQYLEGLYLILKSL